MQTLLNKIANTTSGTDTLPLRVAAGGIFLLTAHRNYLAGLAVTASKVPLAGWPP